MNNKQIGNLTVSELKNIIMTCLQDFEEGKQRQTSAGLEAAYKQLWIKTPIITDEGFKCND